MYFEFQPKFQKTSFRAGGGSTQSSLSANNDDPRFNDQRVRPNRDNHMHPSEILPQLSIIQEDRGIEQPDYCHAESSGGGTPRDDKKRKKKQGKHKAKDSSSGKETAAAETESSFIIKPGVGDRAPASIADPSPRATFTIGGSDPTPSVPASNENANGKWPPKDGARLLSTAGMKGCMSLNPSSNDLVTGDAMRFSMGRPSTSRRSSRTDLNCDPHRRTTSVISAANSYGSGLDDDDLIDPLRDVGIAVTIVGGYFAWQPQATEALLSDVNFTADAGEC